MPDEVKYTLRMQEYAFNCVVLRFNFKLFIYSRNGPYYFHAQDVKISKDDYLWKRPPEDFCRGNLNKKMIERLLFRLRYIEPFLLFISVCRYTISYRLTDY